jgi:hypothetical protein
MFHTLVIQGEIQKWCACCNVFVIKKSRKWIIVARCSILSQQRNLHRAALTAIFYCLIWDSPNLEGQVPIFISPRNRVAQLYPRALCSLSVASYESQGLRWRYSNPPAHGWVVTSSSASSYIATAVRWPVRLDVGDDQILFFLFDNLFLLHVERPLWREDGSVIRSAITHWLQLRKTSNHTLVSSETHPTWRASSPCWCP